MFGYQGAESGETPARGHGDMAGAKRQWPFLTKFDLTTIRDEPELATVIRDRTGLPGDQADDAVHRRTIAETVRV